MEPLHGIFSDIWDTVTGTAQMAAENISAEWTSRVNQLKAKAQEFQRAFDALLSMQSVAARAPGYDGYQALVARGNQIKASISAMTRAIDAVRNSAGQLFGLGDLGIIQIPAIVTVSALTGAIAIMSYFINDAYKETQRLQSLERQGQLVREAGGSATQIEKIFTSNMPVSTTTNLRYISYALVIGLGIYYLIGKGKKA